LTPSLRRHLLAAGAGTFGILLLVLLWRYLAKHPPCCDARGYLVMANGYLGWDAPADLFAELRGIRTYGYPAFLAPLLLVAKWVGAAPALLIFLVQVVLYWLAAWFLASEYGHLHGEPAGRLARYALLANVLVYPLLAIPLTDGVSVCLLFFLLALGLRWLRTQDDVAAPAGWHLLYVLPFGLLTGFALMVRPGNLTFLGVALLALVFAVVVSARKHRGSPDGALSLLLFAAGFLLVVVPQLSINVMHYGKWTILPNVELGASVLEFGKQVLKYLTNLSGTEIQQCYRVPWAVPPGVGASWYLLNPVAGFKTAALHVFSALDYDYFFPYVYNLKPSYRPVLFVYVHACLFFGAVGLVARTAEARLGRWGGAEFLIAASISYIAMWAALQSVVHAEVRYSIGVSSLLLLFAPWGWGVVARHRARLLGLLAAYLLLAWLLSDFLSGLMAGCFGK
jgi:hypothetical protein